MSTVILRGEKAIHYAEEHRLQLSCDSDESGMAREGLSIQQAREIQETHPGHIWIETHVGVNPGEPAPSA